MNKSDEKLRQRAIYIQTMYKYYTNTEKLRHVVIVEKLADDLFISVGTIEKDLRKIF